LARSRVFPYSILLTPSFRNEERISFSWGFFRSSLLAFPGRQHWRWLRWGFISSLLWLSWQPPNAKPRSAKHTAPSPPPIFRPSICNPQPLTLEPPRFRSGLLLLHILFNFNGDARWKGANGKCETGKGKKEKRSGGLAHLGWPN